MNYAAALILAALIGLYLVRRDMAGPELAAQVLGNSDDATPDNPYGLPVEEGGPEQLPTFLQSISVTASEAAAAIPELIGLAAPPPPPDLAARNERAFLDMIAYAEGTAGADGYRAMFGYPAPGRLAASLVDHPRKFFYFTDKNGKTDKTSAAGRYQFLLGTWDELARKLSLPDFSEESQDRAAIELVRQRGALRDVQAGRVSEAIAKVAKIWASLPGAGYAQPERKLPALLASFQQAGGNLEA